MRRFRYVLFVMAALSAPATAQIFFQDIASDPGSGLTYAHVETPRAIAFLDRVTADPVVPTAETPFTPAKPWGAPGVALLDHDNDGDVDIYVTNAPGAPNSLFSNQLRETGELHFVDVAKSAGVALTDEESTGVCYGDLDNDGDHDLYVLTLGAPNHLFENLGADDDGRVTFRDVTAESGAGGGERHPTSCSMGDVDNDGLLDVAIANTALTWDNMVAMFIEPFAANEANQLLGNLGGNLFEDVSESSGILHQRGLPASDGQPGLTWAVAMVDYDLDGDVDVFFADDQAALDSALYGGLDRGLLHLFQNDGSGHFTDVNVEAGLAIAGAWMGFAFADFNADGHLDFFATNHGDYLRPFLGLDYVLGDEATRWFLARGNGTFGDPGVGDLVATPFGWGAVAVDYDNDGDTDVAFHGGLDIGLMIESSNPGVVLRNEGGVSFTWDRGALGSPDHGRRTVHGVAAGDLDNDGFLDLVSVASSVTPLEMTIPVPFGWGSPFDATALFGLVLVPGESPDEMIWTGQAPGPGTLGVEISSGAEKRRHRWVKARLRGSAATVAGARGNRDGIGAVVSFRTPAGKRMMQPVMGGDSYASQSSLGVHFGLGSARGGRMEVLWPGGVRNRLYGVRPGEEVLFPEIPCGFDADWPSAFEYLRCVGDALDGLGEAEVLDRRQKKRFLLSAFRAYVDHRG